MIVKCVCDCGKEFEELDSRGRARKFIYGHGNKGRKFPNLKHDKQFKKGQSPWNKGVHVENAGTFKVGQQAFLGKKHSEATKAKMRLAQRGHPATVKGAAHWKWKGGITKSDKLQREKLRKTIGRDVLRRDHYKCVKCDDGGYLHVDHIKGWADYPELRDDPNNLQTLCNKCHYEKTFGRKMPDDVNWGIV